ncbi:MAG: BMP family ABC transporter substrate-binding protein [Erysipelotrichales bacterium]
MKKFASIASALVLAVLLTACGGNDQAKDCKTTGIVVTDIGGVDDKSFNQSAHEGLLKFAEDNKDKGACAAKSIQSSTDADLVPNLSTASSGSNQLVVAAGYKFKDPITEVAKKYPDQKYLIIDDFVDHKNVASAVFAANEGSFLAGVASATKAKEAGKNTIGFIGGGDSPIIAAFAAGYKQGAEAAYPGIKVKIQYTGDFADASKAKTMATQMYNDGTYIIYQAAGNAGNGVISAAKELVKDQGKDVWVVGVDKDQYDEGKYDGDKSVILTSMVKNIYVPVSETLQSILDGGFKGGRLDYNLKNDGVGLPKENPNLDEKTMKKVEEFKQKIIKGEIKVNEKIK